MISGRFFFHSFIVYFLPVSGILHSTSAMWQSVLLALNLMKRAPQAKSAAGGQNSETPPEGRFEMVAVRAQRQAPRIYCLGIRRGDAKISQLRRWRKNLLHLSDGLLE